MPHSSSCPEQVGSRPAFEVADIFRAKGDAYNQTHLLTPEQGRVLRHLAACRTPALGGHLDVCDSCGFQRPAYNSCRDRHCPKCQGAAQLAWVDQHMARILPSHYFHVVATLPAQLRPLVHTNRRTLFNLLFAAASQTLLRLGQDRFGALLGITAVLHTWARNLSFHPHLHLIVTGGGLTSDQTAWTAAGQNYLFPHLVLSRLFRGKFLAGLDRLHDQGKLELRGECESLAQHDVFAAFKDQLYRKEWVAYQKPPFSGPEDVYRYLGRYTHRVAISNWRIQAIDQDSVRFKTKHGQTVTLDHQEFIRRFLLHVLPKGFVKIRHYGLLAPAQAKARLETARRQLTPQATVPEPTLHTPTGPGSPAETEQDPTTIALQAPRCPSCGVGWLRRLPILSPQPRSRSP